MNTAGNELNFVACFADANWIYLKGVDELKEKKNRFTLGLCNQYYLNVMQSWSCIEGMVCILLRFTNNMDSHLAIYLAWIKRKFVTVKLSIRITASLLKNIFSEPCLTVTSYVSFLADYVRF